MGCYMVIFVILYPNRVLYDSRFSCLRLQRGNSRQLKRNIGIMNEILYSVGELRSNKLSPRNLLK